ncbi:DNA-binding NtrC family response regulator [Inhella inkyongensis]|uniref:DNA-binding NtrC family response regulator n=1 Tax=Inhella inkyongensis TaxID=392593 RepID=A0A840S213_9BURK|nr:sigma-54 dependent transcriptional regulator [Inhella inkyongensis]MBB5203458.1 DNA-binding NtrC family response regulator [Inhella inkyongensis]
MPTLLVIDDNPDVCAALQLMFSLHGITTLSAGSPEQGLKQLARADLVIQDMNFSADTTSGAEGVALFQQIRARAPDLPIILLTAWTQLERAVELVKAGAADYLGKPWDDSKLLATVQNLLELGEAQGRLREQARQQRQRRERLQQQLQLDGLVAESPAMLSLLELAAPVARSTLPTLITGPNGSGKERIAQLLHANSPRAGRPLVALNCGALPSELIEAELFGAEAGAYTGAQKARIGHIESADGGTLFLDEIGNLPLSGQAKLLRVLETGEFQRLGSAKLQRADVRLISATNADLPAQIRTGQFREDLYYRLNGIELRLAPLAERVEDIEPLAEQFLGGRGVLSEGARERLRQHPWPGNVRELRHCMERALLLAQEHPIQTEHLALGAAPIEARNLDEPSRPVLQAALQAAGGNISRVAAQFGLSRQAVYRRLHHHGL